MDFEFSDEQLALRDSTRRLLAADGQVTATREMADAAAGYDEKLWRRGAELGWAAMAIPEEADGLGQSIADWVMIAAEHGRAVLPTPFLGVCVVADSLARTGDSAHAEVLNALLEGSATAAWGFAERGRSFSVEALRTTATRDGDEYVLAGAKASVADAGSAAWLLIDAVLDGVPARFLVPAGTAGITITRQQSLDVTRELSDVVLDLVPVPAAALVAEGPAAAAGMERSQALAAVLACGELIGAGEQMLDLTVEYAKVRVQFDVPIGSFQAVKHKCADMRIQVQAATAATYYAAMALNDDAPDALRAVSVAKSFTSDAITKVAGDALQTHGGIGFTWEHDLHLYIRRVNVNALLYGDVTHHRELLCRSLEEHGAGAVAQRS